MGTALAKIRKTKPSFDAEEQKALRRMPADRRENIVTARPEGEFGVAPVLPDDAKQAIAEVIEEYGIRPPRGWVVIKQVPAAERIGLILVPQAAEKPPSMGIVIAVSEGTFEHGQLVPPQVKIGDHITFPEFAGLSVKIAGEEFTQLREDEIMLISARPGGRV